MNDRIWDIVSKWGFKKLSNVDYDFISFSLHKNRTRFIFEISRLRQELLFTIQFLSEDNEIKYQFRRTNKLEFLNDLPNENLRYILKDIIEEGILKVYRYMIFKEK